MENSDKKADVVNGTPEQEEGSITCMLDDTKLIEAMNNDDARTRRNTKNEYRAALSGMPGS
jgi:hypothetical protein